MSRKRTSLGDVRPELPDQLNELLGIERRVAEKTQTARRRGVALIEAVRIGAAEHESRLKRTIAEGFPDIERRVLAEQEAVFQKLLEDSNKRALRFESIDADAIRSIASDIVTRIVIGE